MSLRTLLFDLDGTTVEHLPAIHRCYCYTLPRVGLPAPTYEKVKNAIGGGLEHAMSQLVPAELLDQALALYRPHWQATHLDGVEAMPGTLDLLRQLHQRQITNAILTNKHGPSAREVCTFLGFDPYLRAVIGAKDTPWLKPDPALTRHTLAQLDADPATTLLIGDSPFDVQTGLNAGFPVWAVTTGTHTAEALHAAGATQVFPDLPTLTPQLLAALA